MCPPGTDQTCRGPQRWNLMVPDRTQRYPVPVERRDVYWEKDLHTLLEGDWSFDAFEKLARWREIPSAPDLTGCVVHHGLSPIEELPAELLSLVFSDGNLAKEDVIRLGTCSQTLWTHAVRQMQMDARASAAPWADTPMLCTGTYLRTVPPELCKHYPTLTADQDRWRDLPCKISQGPVGTFCTKLQCPWRLFRSVALQQGPHQEHYTKLLVSIPAVSGTRCWADIMQDEFSDR